MSKLGSALRSADTSYQAAMRRMVSGRGNLVRQVEQFRELGASVRKTMPREVLDESAAESGSFEEMDEPELLESDSDVEEETET
jgi:DNA anti-recombination protein RmuC